MAGGYITLSGNKNKSINTRLQFILFKYKLKYNAYIIRKNNMCIYNIDIFIKGEQRLLLVLTGDLRLLEKEIYKTLNNELIQINYREPK